MALTISKPTVYGIPATYWRISEATAISPRAKTASVMLNGYASKAASTGEPLATFGVSLNPDKFADYIEADEDTDLRAGLYEYLKTTEDFATATNA